MIAANESFCAVAADVVTCGLGIPCVISATGATRKIPNGARVRVDGNTGVLTVLAVA